MMKKRLTIFFLLYLIIVSSISLMAQDWNQIIKTAASDRMTPINSRISYDNYGCSVSIDGDYAVVGSIGNTGNAYVLYNNAGTWQTVKQLNAPDNPTSSDYFGRSVSISGNYVIVGAYMESEDAAGTNTLNNAGSAYIFSKDEGGINNWGFVKKIVASDRAVADNFGYSVSISGNYVVVGAYLEDEDAAGLNTFSKAGSAYIFAKDQGGANNWGQVKKIVASDRATLDNFGYAVSISGSYVIVGANLEAHDATGANPMAGAGSAYIFAKDQGGADNWGEVKKIVASDRATYNFFANSVSISGNYAIVGDNTQNSYKGAAYIYAKDQGGADNWGQVKKIVSSDGDAEDCFGMYVSISGNYVIVGANNEKLDASGANLLINAGSAYLFAKDQGGADNWGQVKKIVASDRASYDNFGISVSISGNKIIVGAPYQKYDPNGDHPVSDAGSAYIFAIDEGGTNNWGQTTKSIAVGTIHRCDGQYGMSVAIDGDYAVVGTSTEGKDGSGSNYLGNAGVAYILKNNGTTWTEIKKIVASDRAENDYFGYTVSISGNYVVVGAYGEDEDASGTNALESAGSAYLFAKDQGGADNWGQVKKIVASDRAEYDNFGSAVSISGNYIIVGAYMEDHDAAGAGSLSDAGSAYLFAKDQGGADNWGQLKKIVASDRAASDYFGYSISISGNHFIIGANQEDHDADGATTQSNAGSAYLFAKDQGGADNWGQVKKIVASDRSSNDYFGCSVSISGNYVVAGAYKEDHDAAGANLFTDAGSAYIFAKDQSGTDNWGQAKKIVASDRVAKDYFGYSVSISGNYVIVGAYQEDEDAAGANTLSNAGSAYVFAKDQGGADTWGQAKKIVASDRTTNDNLGKSVSISGSNIIVGAPYEEKDGAGANFLYNAGSAYIFASFNWDGSESSDWNTATNWSCNTVPTETVNVLIPHVATDPVVNLAAATPAMCNNLTIESGAVLTIPAGKALTVNGTLTNNAGITGLVIQSASSAADGTGALLNSTAGVQGTVERYVSGDLWHLISPAATVGETVANFVDLANGNLVARNANNYALASWLELTGKWDYYKVSGSNTTGQFGSPAKGFQVMRATGAGSRIGTDVAGSGKLTFIGTMAAADQNIDVAKSGNGWNLVGNPYPCALNIETFLAVNAPLLDPSYRYIYISKIVDVTTYGYDPNSNGLKLASGEGFFVKTITGGGTIHFTTEMKSSVADAFKAATIDCPTVQLTVEDGNEKLATTVKYEGGATKGLDPGKDAGLFNGTASSFSLFTRLVEDNGVDFTIQALPDNNLESMVVPVGLVADKGATVTFKATAANFPVGYKVYLEDKETGAFTRLDEANSTYTVSLNAASSGTGRFYLHTTEIVSAVDNALLNEFKVVPMPEQHFVRIIGNFDIPAKAMVYDMNGKLVATSALTAQIENTIALNNASSGVYLLKVDSGKGVETVKFVWKRK